MLRSDARQNTIADLLPSSGSDCNALVDAFLGERGLGAIEGSFNNEPWKARSFEERLRNLVAYAEDGKKLAVVIYERECGDVATFRYYGHNVVERLSESNEWNAEFFFLDEVGALDDYLNRISLAVLVRMRLCPDLVKFALRARQGGTRIAYMIDDDVLGFDAAPTVAEVMVNKDGDVEWETNFWYGAATRFEQASKLADCLIASTSFLALRLRLRYGKPVFVLEPSLNDAQVAISNQIVDMVRPVSNQGLSIGYFSGTKSHDADFLLVEDALVSYLDSHADARLVLVGQLSLSERVCRLVESGQVVLLPPVDFVRLQALQASVDVVIAPLEINDFTNCKSALKAFEAGAVGTTACASPSTAYQEEIEDGVTGFLCANTEGWLRAFETLSSGDTPSEMGEHARKRALERHYGRNVTSSIERAYNQAVSCDQVGNFEEALRDAEEMFATLPDDLVNWDDPFAVNVLIGQKLRQKTPIEKLLAQPRIAQVVDIMHAVATKYEREGVHGVGSVLAENLDRRYKVIHQQFFDPESISFVDVLFINGCARSLPHPIRYRVEHQMEQLNACGLTAESVDAWNLTPEHVTKARAFVIFRCPFTPEIGEFIDLAKRLNKRVFFDIDDLVVDRKYTDTIKFLETMNPQVRADYDDGVDKMGETLKACGAAITTTERLAKELKTIVPEVFINRNVASADMLFYSNRAVYERDVLPFISDCDIEQSELVHKKWAIEQLKRKDEQGVVIGYFSGSITHNDDFNMILPALVDVLEARPEVSLMVVGILDIPHELEQYSDRIITGEFGSWTRLPDVIARTDINIVPLEDSVFNEAKSENKWVEAALVKVPTVASDIGAFRHAIKHGETGLLCRTLDEWRESLLRLVDDKQLREALGNAARYQCVENNVTLTTGFDLVKFFRSCFTKNYFVALPSLNVSGGMLVALKHCSILQAAGYDVTVIDDSIEGMGKSFIEFDNRIFPVVRARSSRNKTAKNLLWGSVDVGVATMWSTLDCLDICSTIKKKVYLVQNYEAGFYSLVNGPRMRANATYGRDDVDYRTISLWCQRWLGRYTGLDVKYAPNGIDPSLFACHERRFDGERKVRILIEGDSQSEYKNVDEAFRVTNMLDHDRFEIWYLSYRGGPKPFYKVDKFLNQVPYEEVGSVYAECDFLLKTSLLESFSYPPLEMMATGGYVVAIPNEGNAEYLVHGNNCLLFNSGDTATAIASIELIASDSHVRAILSEGAKQTVQQRDWANCAEQVLGLYE